ncbi:MAG: bifunctional metallophosphatase/5'-nucleotidase [Deltaproteobacteria bacterium]|nr:bifunctional metallophosphatase/5'-nucleotidase [Deltaproteobacteria bacterium]
MGFLGLVLNDNRRVNDVIAGEGLKAIRPLKAVNRFVPEMGPLDLTVLMIHDDLRDILTLAGQISPDLGVDLILSGHNHVVLEPPLERNGIFIFQAGAMNRYYGVVTVSVEKGRVLNVENRLMENMPSSLDRAALRLKEVSDGMKGEPVAVLKRSLLGACMQGKENSIGDFVTDAFRWATGSDVAMTNSSSLRKGFRIFPGEFRTLREGDFKNMTPFQNHLVTGVVTGDQLMRILEGDALHFVNQVSGIRYTIDSEKPRGQRVIHARIDGKLVVADQTYTLTHNAYCARPENMRKYLHLKPGSIEWKTTPLLDYEALIRYARHLKVIDYPSEGEGRIRHLP